MKAWVADAYDSAPVPFKRLLMNVYARYLHVVREGEPMRRAIDTMERVDRLAPADIAAWQLERVNDLLVWAEERVPYYRGRVLVGSGPAGRLSNLGEIDRIPELTKDEVRAHKDALTARGVKTYYGHTSGTTGTPLQLWYDRGQLAWNRAAEKVMRRRAGLSDGDRVAVIWGRAIVPRTARRPPYWIVNDADREIWLSAFHVGQATAPLYFDAIRRYGAVALETYPSLAYVLARIALEKREKLPLRSVVTSSETLFDFQRETIQEAFGAEVFDFYGAAERAAFAIECPQHDGLHLLEAFGYVEPTPGDEPVTTLSLTALTNRAMPLIRYQMTDVTRVIEEPCSCGLTSRRLAPISTKKEDLVVTPDGRFVSPSVLTHPFKPLVGVLRSQIIQESLDELVVRLETSDGYDRTQEQELRKALEDRMGPGVEIRIVEEPVLETELSGKFRWVISKVRGLHQLVEPTT